MIHDSLYYFGLNNEGLLGDLASAAAASFRAMLPTPTELREFLYSLPL